MSSLCVPFPSLTDKEKDESEQVLTAFSKICNSTLNQYGKCYRHPLQGLTDAITISENTTKKRPKVVLSWAPHVKALPHAVGNSFIQPCKKWTLTLSLQIQKAMI